MRCKLFLVLVLLFAFLLSFEASYAVKPAFYPDFSSPESTFWTDTHAIKTNNHGLFLDCRDEKHREQWGDTRDVQLAYVREMRKKEYYSREWTRQIVDIRIMRMKGGDVIIAVIFYQTIGGRDDSAVHRMHLRQYSDMWKITII